MSDDGGAETSTGGGGLEDIASDYAEDDPDDTDDTETSAGGGSRDTTLDRGTTGSGDGGDSGPEPDLPDRDRQTPSPPDSPETDDRRSTGSGVDRRTREPSAPEPDLSDRDRQTPSAPDPPPAEQVGDVDVRVGNQPADETTFTVDEGTVRSDLRESIAEQEGVDPSDVEIIREGDTYRIRGDGFRGEIGVDAVAESLEEGTAAQSDPFGPGDVVAEPTDDGFRVGVTHEAVDDYREQRRAEFEAGLGLDAAGGQVDTTSFSVPEGGMPDVGDEAPAGVTIDPETVPTGRGSRTVGLDPDAVDRDVSGPTDSDDGGVSIPGVDDAPTAAIFAAPTAAASAFESFASDRDVSVGGFRAWQREQQRRIDEATLDDPIEEATEGFPDESDVTAASRAVAADVFGFGVELGGEALAEIDPRREGPVEESVGDAIGGPPPLVSAIGPRGLASGARGGVDTIRRITSPPGASAPGGAARTGPSAGSAVGQTAEFAPAAVDRILQAGAAVGAGAAGAATLTESEIPAPERPASEQAEIEQPTDVGVGVGGGEIEAPVSRDFGVDELPTPAEPRGSSGEIPVPDEPIGVDRVEPGELQLTQTGMFREEEEEQVDDFLRPDDDGVLIGGEDIVTDLPEPEQDPPATRERIRREDLVSPERDFPGREEQVVGRGETPPQEPELNPDPVTVTEPATTPTGAEETLLGVSPGQGSTPLVGSLLGLDETVDALQRERERADVVARQDSLTDPLSGTVPATTTDAATDTVTMQDDVLRPQLTVPGLDVVETPGFGTPTETQTVPEQTTPGLGIGTPGFGLETPPPPLDLGLPARGDDRGRGEIEPFVEEEITEFRDPLGDFFGE